MTGSTREVSLRWVAERLALAQPEAERSEFADRAEVLVTIAEQYRVSIEMLILWIDTTAPGKQWAAAEWRRWCERYRTSIEIAERLAGERL